MATQHNTTPDTCGNGRVEQPDDLVYFGAKRYELDPGVRARQTMERAVIRTLAQSLLDAGFSLRVWEGEDWAGPLTTSRDRIMADIMSVDEEYLYVYRGDGENRPARIGVLFLVYGNDGYDVISDYSTNLEPFLAPVHKLIEELEPK